MKKTIGKLYTSDNEFVVLCTGHGAKGTTKHFSGVVVQSTNPEFPIGDYSEYWTGVGDIFNEFEGKVTLNNQDYKEPIEISGIKNN